MASVYLSFLSDKQPDIHCTLQVAWQSGAGAVVCKLLIV
jgi:hypothetical protein